MIIPSNIETLELLYNDTPLDLVFTTMEAVDQELGGIADVPHMHNYYTVIWPVNASGKHLIDFKEYPIKDDHVFFVSPGQVHQVIADPNPVGYVILFTTDFLQKNSINKEFISDLNLFVKSTETPPLYINISVAARLKFLAEEMKSAFENYISGNNKSIMMEKAGACLKLFLIECNTNCSGLNIQNIQSYEVEKSLIKQFKELLELNFKIEHSVAGYASMLNVTPNYLNEVIRESVNVSAKEMITGRIILEAKRMLLFTKLSSKQIGFELGFENPSHFSRFFISASGLSMQEFRNRNIDTLP